MGDTIKTDTALIEEGVPWLESVRFENEPWTSFYLTGEIVGGLGLIARALSSHPEKSVE
jgi:hypothetical protein